MNRHLATLALLLSALCAFSAVVDEVDLSPLDDAADAAAARPLVSNKNLKPGMIDVSCDEATLSDVIRQFRKVTRANIISSDTTNLQRRVSVELKNVPWYDALRTILNSRGFRLDERNNIFYVEQDDNKIVTRSYILNHASAEELADLFNGYTLKRERTVSKSGKAEESVKSFESKFSAMDGKVRASAFPNANVLVLSGLVDDLVACEAIIKSIDRAATQVYIEARFMELSSEAKRELGIKWNSMAKVGLTSSGQTLKNEIAASRDSDLSGLFKDLGGIATSYAGAYSGTLTATDFGLFLSAFDEVGGSQVFSNPRVIISNGKEAVIDMTTKFPNLKITSQRNTTSGQTYTDYTAQLEEIQGDKEKGLFAGSAFFSWGITLSVKPRISPEGLISVCIEPSISELDKDVFNGDGFYQVQGGSSGDEEKDQAAYGKYPIIRMKSINTDFTMKDGCTAVIGGLSRTEEADVDNGIPGLRSIPWIGPRIFGWKSREKIQKEIIICVTIGIANPETLRKDVGLPHNAVIGREYIDGRRQEPGDRPDAATYLKDLDSTPLDWHSRYKDYQLRKEGERAAFPENTDEEIDLEGTAPVQPKPAVATEAPKAEPVVATEAPKAEPIAEAKAPKEEPAVAAEAPKAEPVAEDEAAFGSDPATEEPTAKKSHSRRH